MKKSKKIQGHTHISCSHVNFFGMKRHPLCSVQKRQDECVKIDLMLIYLQELMSSGVPEFFQIFL